MDTFSMITGTTLNRYQLDIPSCTASLDVEEFSGAEKLSELYYYTITFTSAEKNIDAAQLLSKPAMLTMGGGALQQLADCKRVHGVVTAFRRISSSEDQSTYQITLQPFLSLLDKQFRSHRFFVNKSVPEVVEQVLQEHHLHDWEYEFNLKQHYPRREQINQYQESDLAFIQRLLAIFGVVALIKHDQRRGNGVDLNLRRQLTGKRAGHIIQCRFTGRVGNMFIAAAFNDIVSDMNNVAGGVSVPAQERFQRMVEQIGGMNVDLHHAGQHRGEWNARLFSHPVAGVPILARRPPAAWCFTASAKASICSSVLKSAVRQIAPASRSASMAG